MQENKEDTERTYIFHLEKIEVEISADTQGTTVGKLIVYQLMRNEPANQNTGQETDNRQEDLASHKIEDIE
jgi:hypothetical protein